MTGRFNWNFGRISRFLSHCLVHTCRSFSFSFDLIQVLPWVCGSMRSGYLVAFVTIMPFWIERSSPGNPCSPHSPIWITGNGYGHSKENKNAFISNQKYHNLKEFKIWTFFFPLRLCNSLPRKKPKLVNVIQIILNKNKKQLYHLINPSSNNSRLGLVLYAEFSYLQGNTVKSIAYETWFEEFEAWLLNIQRT